MLIPKIDYTGISSLFDDAYTLRALGTRLLGPDSSVD